VTVNSLVYRTLVMAFSYKPRMERELKKMREALAIPCIISAPHLVCAAKCKEIKDRNPNCFNPDSDFGRFGVVPETGSAGWVEVWGRALKVCIERKGTAYFMYCDNPELSGLIGSQQGGEHALCHDLAGNALLKIELEHYTLSPQQVKEIEDKRLEKRHAERFGTDRVFKIADLTILRELGAGTFAKVHLTTLRTGPNGNFSVAVAAKELSITSSERERGEDQLQREYKAMLRLCGHPNIVQIHGVVLDAPQSLYLVMEYVQGGSLKFVLGNTPNLVVKSKRVQFDVAQGVASGMHAMHGLDPPLLHRDLKSANILLCSSRGRCVPKLTDFGLSVGLSSVGTTSAVSKGGTFRYFAPELFDLEDKPAVPTKVLKPSEVYAYAMVLSEILTGRLVWVSATNPQTFKAVYADKKRPCLSDSDASSQLGKLCQDCWSHDPDTRPTFSDVMLRLAEIERTMAVCMSQTPPPRDALELNEKVRTLEDENSELKQKMQELKTRVKDIFSGSVVSAQASVSAELAEENQREARRQQSKFERTISVLQGENQVLPTTFSDLESKNEELKAELAKQKLRAEQEIEKTKSQAQTILQETVDRAQEKITELETQSNAYRGMLDVFQEQLIDLTAKLEASQLDGISQNMKLWW